MKEPIYSKNERIEFMDSARVHHVGYVKASHVKRKLFRTETWYDVCEITKEHSKRVFEVKEDWIFGIIERKDHKRNKQEDEI